MANRVRVYVRDEDYSIRGEIDQLTLVDIRLRHREVGTWSIDLPTDDDASFGYQSSLLVPGRGIIVTYDDEVFVSGPITFAEIQEQGTKQVSGVDDLVWLGARLAVPAAPSLSQTIRHADVRTAVAETLAYGYVSDNLGPTALAERQAVRVRTSQGRGSTVSESARNEPVLDVISRALAIDGYGMRCISDRSDPGLPYFEVVVPRDQRGVVEFSNARGTLGGGSKRTDQAPAATWTLVGGSGESTARTFLTRQNVVQEAIWGRWETFADARDTADLVVLAQRGDEDVAPLGPVIEVAALETVGTRFGDWRLGDLVTAQVLGAADYFYVTEVRLEYGRGVGENPRLTPTLTPSSTVRLEQLALLRDRVSALESRQ